MAKLLLTEEEQQEYPEIIKAMFPGMAVILDKVELTETGIRTKTKNIPGGPYTVNLEVKADQG